MTTYRFDNILIQHYNSEVISEQHYYPFGLTLDIDNDATVTTNPYKYNTKELERHFGLESYEYGARMMDPQLGMWHTIDNKAELYKNLSPYVYAADQPTNAIDPDGNLIIFVNGFTLTKDEQGTERYWRSYTTYNQPNMDGEGHVYNKKVEMIDKAFDLEVSRQLGDDHRKYIHGGNALDPTDRSSAGYNQGYSDAPAIIESLHKTNGVIDETLKFITHSMGGVYGDWYIAGLMMYIYNEHPELAKQIKITLVADFDPFQAKYIYNTGVLKKMQFLHKGWGNITGGLANEKEEGKEDSYQYYNTPGSSHFIMSFFSDISKLKEGTYTWNADTNQWEYNNSIK